jgi:GT2 family glycosyltransferase
MRATPNSRTHLPTVSVVIAACSMNRWDDLLAAVASAGEQTISVLETVVVIDHHPGLLARARERIPGVTVIPNTRQRGASGARNSGVAASRGEVVAFLDDDAVASPSWLENLLGHFASPGVIGVGGLLDPLWAVRRPRWFPPEFDWAVGGSYPGMPGAAMPMRNVWSGNMAIRRHVFDAVGGFREGFGKVGGQACPEDTDLCLRAAMAARGGMWIYEPTGIVGHRVPAERATFSYFCARCFNEGQGKAALAALNGAGESTSAERRYARQVLPRGIARGLREAVHGDIAGVSRSLAIAIGLLLAMVGFAVGCSAALLRPLRAFGESSGPDSETDRVTVSTALPGGEPVMAQGFSPIRVMEVELTVPLPVMSDDGVHRRAYVLARLHSEPVGACVIDMGEAGLTACQLGALLWAGLSEAVTTRFAAAGLPVPRMLPEAGLRADPAAWPYLRGRSQVLAEPPFISIVLCTRDRADQLAVCLGHLRRLEYPRFEVVVVDNAPTTEAVRATAESQRGGLELRYVVEPRAGLSWARNAGAAAAAGAIIAFLDDDERPDRHWLAEIARGFAQADDIGCVTGMILPAQLDTAAQDWFERSGGHSKGRGFTPALFAGSGPQNPLYPLPPFGAGGNMAFRREALARIGGFDVAMGAGTPARASEDTLAFTLTLLAGYRIAYQPSAFVRHNHYPDAEGVGRQMYGYGVGLTAYYTALLRHRPSVFPGLMRLIPTVVGYLRGAKTQRVAGPGEPLEQLGRQMRRGMLSGPAAYLRSLHVQSRVATRQCGLETEP